MQPVLTAAQVREVERAAVQRSGGSLYDLMEIAGEAVARTVKPLAGAGRVVVVTGPGNNGGDGWVAARRLHSEGIAVTVCSLVEPGSLAGNAGVAAMRAADAGVLSECVPASEVGARLSGATVVVDALLGIGARAPLSPELALWTTAIRTAGARVVAVDVPTGVDADTGEADEHAVIADVTLTFITPKRGLVTYPGAAHAGELVVEPLGVPPELTSVPGAPEILSPREYASILPRPAAHAHKNQRGRVLVVAGSGRFPGAAVLAARGAMRAGAGYVTLVVPEPVVPIAQSHLLAATVVGLPAGRSKAFTSHASAAVLDLASDYDAVVVGPGLTLADGAVGMARQLVTSLAKPLVLDADGLNALVDARYLLDDRTAPTVLTPHPGELGRLLGQSAESVQSDRLLAAGSLVGSHRAVVLKGAGTVISGAERTVITRAGSPALATAGTGDVLAGMVGTYLAQGLDPFAAGCLAAYVHGKAGEAAARDLTEICVTAEDVPAYVAKAVAGLLGE